MKTKDKVSIPIEGQEVIISNPEKILWPELGITKLEYLQKLLILAPYLLPYCRNRYLTTIRYPNGIHSKSFYQKNAPDPLPSYVNTAEMQSIHYVVLDSVPTLLWLGNLACLEFHPSFHMVNNQMPMEWIIDIDPTLEQEPRIMDAVSLIGEALDKMNIRAIPKTSGATGVQLYVPIQLKYTFEELRVIGEFLGKYLVQKHPRLFTIERFVKNRGDLIYVDYLQHWYGKTLSAPYTPRARPAASVSTPLTWREVENRVDPREFNLRTIERRLQQCGDLIAAEPPQSLDHVLSILQ